MADFPGVSYLSCSSSLTTPRRPAGRLGSRLGCHPFATLLPRHKQIYMPFISLSIRPFGTQRRKMHCQRGAGARACKDASEQVVDLVRDESEKTGHGMKAPIERGRECQASGSIAGRVQLGRRRANDWGLRHWQCRSCSFVTDFWRYD